MKPQSKSGLSKTFNAQAARNKPKQPALPPLSIRVTPQEKALLQRLAGKQAISTYVRHRLFGDVTAMRAKRHQEKPKQPKLDHVEIARLLGMFGQSELVRSILALSLAAQAGQLVASSEAEQQISRACDEIHEMKTILITALKVKPQEA